MIELLRKRRSIRKYKPCLIEKEKIEILKEALLRSPTSRNRNPWEFYFIADKPLLDSLSQAKSHGSAFLKDAALGIVICADENQSDVWIEDCSIASILLQLTAQSLGLSSCWIQIRNRQNARGITSEKYIQQLLKLPDNMKVESIIALGYPAEVKDGIPKEQLDYQKIKVR